MATFTLVIEFSINSVTFVYFEGPLSIIREYPMLQHLPSLLEIKIAIAQFMCESLCICLVL